VRLLYLNKASFNGIYRVNTKGEFNVPFGCKPTTVLCEEEKLQRASQLLRVASLVAQDFERTIDSSGPGDLIYADPPYTTKDEGRRFRRYNEVFFSWKDQLRLAEAVHRAQSRGATIAVSNAHCEEVRQLYPDFKAVVLTRWGGISGSKTGRKPVDEYLLLSPGLSEPATRRPRKMEIQHG
jgi:DNA adenine methylase